ncbi:hypothetical protein [Nocardiopsis flavescens]|uniref:hypothetical protein n=1 Tax=Nocardiopsis flavescens TaxID=758803 RepID=UPI001C49E63E|nr:hypothetical protein [Nocardiopsis flavescens]
MEQEPPLVRAVHPELIGVLVPLLEAEGERDLAVVAHDLRLVRPCGCGDGFCQSFFTFDHSHGEAFGPGHRMVALLPETGMINLDVVHGRIVYVEVLDHPPLK